MRLSVGLSEHVADTAGAHLTVSSGPRWGDTPTWHPRISRRSLSFTGTFTLKATLPRTGIFFQRPPRTLGTISGQER